MIRRKAVVAAGGWGTRFGPPSISAEKCMALVDGKPVLQHVVEGLVDAGVEEIAIVVGAMSHQTRMHFGGNLKYEEYLHKKGKEALLEEARRIRSMADFCFIEQGDKQYGTSVPLAKAIGRGSRGMLQRFIKPGDSFLYLAGDQLFTPTEGRSEASIFVERLQRASIHAGMLAVEVPPEEVNKYGIVLTEGKAADGTPLYSRIEEKPAVGTVESTLSNSSFYAFGGDFLEYVKQNMKQPPVGGESRITDALNAYGRAGHPIAVVSASGEYLDCGNVDAIRRADWIMHGPPAGFTRT